MSVVTQWAYGNDWLQWIQEAHEHHWFVQGTRRPLPKGSQPGSRLNTYGDVCFGVYPGTEAWIWVDLASQTLFWGTPRHDLCLYVPRSGHRLGDVCWLDTKTILFIEESEQHDYALIALELATKERRLILQTDRTIASPFLWQDHIHVISWDQHSMPWDLTSVDRCDEGQRHPLALPKAAWTQPWVDGQHLHLVGNLEEYRGVYRVTDPIPQRLSAPSHDVGELEWLRQRTDYCFWQHRLYYAHQKAGLWSWQAGEHALSVPYSAHRCWWLTPQGPVVEGSDHQQSGLWRHDGVILHEEVLLPPMDSWHTRWDQLPNGHPSQSWFQRTPHPVKGSILWLHGGPADVSGPRHHAPTQHYLSDGWDVYHLNLIGSSGMGKSVRTALDGLWGPGDAEDLVATLTLWKEEQFLRGPLIVGHGRSSSAWTLLYACERMHFDGCIFYYPVLEAHALNDEGEPFERPYLQKLLGHAKAPRAPMMPLCLFHGQDDTVVPAAQVLRWWRHHTPHPHSRLFFVPEEGHGFSGHAKKESLSKELTWLNELHTQESSS